MGTVQTFVDPAALTEAAALAIVDRAGQTVAARGRFSIVLSGGSTPRTLYERLAQDDLAARVDWRAVHVFWGDERAVPPDHADSNYRMAREALLDHVALPAQNIHRMGGELFPETAAAEYETVLHAYFGQAAMDGQPLPARFDLVLLGMGDDGHTASLFPGAAAIHEDRRWVTATYVDKLGAWRISLTPVAINAAAEIMLIVTGASKAERLQQVLAGPYQPDVLPAQIVNPAQGHLLWLVDEAAAGRL